MTVMIFHESMHSTEKQSLDYVESLVAANHAPPQLEARVSRHQRIRVFGEVVVISCMDSRAHPASSMDPHDGPALSQMSGLAGHIPLDRSLYAIFGHSTQGVIYASHWDGNRPDGQMGFAGCGARDARHRMQTGENMHIGAARYITDHVSPHCITGAVEQSLKTSEIIDVPCYAIGMSHITQQPHLLAVSQNGRLQYQTDLDNIRNLPPQPIPDNIKEEHPAVMRMLQQGEIFARSQTPQEMQRRQVQDPHLVWVTGSHYPTWDVFGPSLGEIMRIGYYRDRKNMLRDGELAHIADHTSYPFYIATEGKHEFSHTNALMIDGKEQQIYQTIWRRLKREPETNLWLDSDKRVVFGAVVRAGKIMSHERLH